MKPKQSVKGSTDLEDFDFEDYDEDEPKADETDTSEDEEQDEVSKTYSFPKSYVSYRKPRAVSTKQRERARQMMIEQNKAKAD